MRQCEADSVLSDLHALVQYNHSSWDPPIKSRTKDGDQLPVVMLSQNCAVRDVDKLRFAIHDPQRMHKGGTLFYFYFQFKQDKSD